MFSFYYGIDPHLTDSVMTLGGIDESLAESEIKYYDIDSPHYWSITASNILLDDEDLNLCPNGCTLIFDTGTSIVSVPSNQLKTM